MIYRAKVGRGELPASDYRLPGAPVTTWLALAFLGLVVVLLFWTESGRTAIIVGVVWGVLVCGGYLAMTNDTARHIRSTAADRHRHPAGRRR